MNRVGVTFSIELLNDCVEQYDIDQVHVHSKLKETSIQLINLPRADGLTISPAIIVKVCRFS